MTSNTVTGVISKGSASVFINGLGDGTVCILTGLKRKENCNEWLLHQRAVLPFRGTSTVWSNDTNVMKFTERKGKVTEC